MLYRTIFILELFTTTNIYANVLLYLYTYPQGLAMINCVIALYVAVYI